MPNSFEDTKKDFHLSRGDRAILQVLKTNPVQDAYQLSKRIPLTPMFIGQSLSRMENAGLVKSSELSGTSNDLSRLFVFLDHDGCRSQ